MKKLLVLLSAIGICGLGNMSSVYAAGSKDAPILIAIDYNGCSLFNQQSGPKMVSINTPYGPTDLPYDSYQQRFFYSDFSAYGGQLVTLKFDSKPAINIGKIAFDNKATDPAQMLVYSSINTTYSKVTISYQLQGLPVYTLSC